MMLCQIEKTDISERLKNIRHVLLDMDGTIYCGNRLFETTIPFFEILAKLDISYSFLTNNSSKSVEDYVNKLLAMGVHVEKTQMYTSTLFASEYLKRNYSGVKKLFVLGTESMKLELCKTGFDIVTSNPDAVIAGYDTELTYEKLCKAAYWINEGAFFISSHPDRFCPTNQPEFIAIDCGCITEFLERLTGKNALVLGKPSPDMLRYALDRYGVAPHESAMAGDRYNTDIKMAVDAGALSIYISARQSEEVSPPDITVPNLLKFGQMLKNVRKGIEQ